MKRGTWLAVALFIFGIPLVSAGPLDFFFGPDSDWILVLAYAAMVFVVFYAGLKQSVFKDDKQQRFAVVFALCVTLLVMKATPIGLIEKYSWVMLIAAPLYMIFYLMQGVFGERSKDGEGGKKWFPWKSLIATAIIGFLVMLLLYPTRAFAGALGGFPLGYAIDELLSDIFYLGFDKMAPVWFALLVGGAIFLIIWLLSKLLGKGGDSTGNWNFGGFLGSLFNGFGSIMGTIFGGLAKAIRFIWEWLIVKPLGFIFKDVLWDTIVMKVLKWIFYDVIWEVLIKKILGWFFYEFLWKVVVLKILGWFFYEFLWKVVVLKWFKWFFVDFLWELLAKRVVVWLWNNIIKPFAVWIWTKVLWPLMKIIWVNILEPIWRNVLKPVLSFFWSWIKRFFQWAWGMVKKFFKWLWEKIRGNSIVVHFETEEEFIDYKLWSALGRVRRSARGGTGIRRTRIKKVKSHKRTWWFFLRRSSREERTFSFPTDKTKPVKVRIKRGRLGLWGFWLFNFGGAQVDLQRTAPYFAEFNPDTPGITGNAMTELSYGNITVRLISGATPGEMKFDVVTSAPDGAGGFMLPSSTEDFYVKVGAESTPRVIVDFEPRVIDEFTNPNDVKVVVKVDDGLGIPVASNVTVTLKKGEPGVNITLDPDNTGSTGVGGGGVAGQFDRIIRFEKDGSDIPQEGKYKFEIDVQPHDTDKYMKPDVKEETMKVRHKGSNPLYGFIYFEENLDDLKNDNSVLTVETTDENDKVGFVGEFKVKSATWMSYRYDAIAGIPIYVIVEDGTGAEIIRKDTITDADGKYKIELGALPGNATPNPMDYPIKVIINPETDVNHNSEYLEEENEGYLLRIKPVVPYNVSAAFNPGNIIPKGTEYSFVLEVKDEEGNSVNDTEVKVFYKKMGEAENEIPNPTGDPWKTNNSGKLIVADLQTIVNEEGDYKFRVVVAEGDRREADKGDISLQILPEREVDFRAEVVGYEGIDVPVVDLNRRVAVRFNAYHAGEEINGEIEQLEGDAMGPMAGNPSMLAVRLTNSGIRTFKFKFKKAGYENKELEFKIKVLGSPGLAGVVNWQPDPVNPTRRALMNVIIVDSVTGVPVSGATAAVEDTRVLSYDERVAGEKKVNVRSGVRVGDGFKTNAAGQLKKPLVLTLYGARNEETRVLKITVRKESFDDISTTFDITFKPGSINEGLPKSKVFGDVL